MTGFTTQELYDLDKAILSARRLYAETQVQEVRLYLARLTPLREKLSHLYAESFDRTASNVLNRKGA